MLHRLPVATHIYKNQYTHPILTDWLSGTACDNYYIPKYVIFENDFYIVMHHSSHPSYTTRFNNVSCCKAYQVLYRKSDLIDINGTSTYELKTGGTKEIKTWEGRINKSKIKADCLNIGIEFPIDVVSRY